MTNNLLFKFKKGGAFNLIYGLFFLFALGLLFIVFNQINQNYLRPVLDNPALNFSQNSTAYADRYLSAWNMMPYVIIFIVGLFFLIWAGINGGKDEFIQ